mmetsp:Transcript_26096/g.48040  ORF Transcript_26096/g.48040 Transcript_26096/m.48040 type:complete len:261 (-) Transcript_26096:945-1727(-)
MENSIIETVPTTISPCSQRHGNFNRFQLPHRTNKPLALRNSARRDRRKKFLRAELRLEHVPSREVTGCHDVAQWQFVPLPVWHGGHGLDFGFQHAGIARIVGMDYLRRAGNDTAHTRFIVHTTIILQIFVTRLNVGQFVMLLHLVIHVHFIVIAESSIATTNDTPTTNSTTSNAPDSLQLLLQTQSHQPLTQLLQMFLPKFHRIWRDTAPHQKLCFVNLRHDLLPGQTFGRRFPLVFAHPGLAGIEAKVAAHVSAVVVAG